MTAAPRLTAWIAGAIALAWAAAPGASRAAEHPSPASDQARQILAATGVKGGLVVHVGCGDGKLTAALRASESYLVHGLDRDAANVERARKHIRSLGLYGRVSVERWAGGRLPYADNLVNLLVAAEPRGVPMNEILRVLAPHGVAYIKRSQPGAAVPQWTKTVKPRPANLDEWTHFLHGADGNAVSRDTVVGPPRHLQWVGAPRWARSHEHLASVSAFVAAGGRIFYVVDAGPAASVTLPSTWFLVARDAFSGVVLWKRPMGLWEGQLRGFRSGPAEIPRRLVAAGDRVYVTLGYGKPLAALDAATGRTVRTYDGTAGTHEIVHHGGVLYLVAGETDAAAAAEAAKRRGASPPIRQKQVLVLKADTGDRLWQKADADTAELLPLTLAVAGGRLFFHSTGHLICLDAASGRERWRVARPVSLKRQAWSVPTLVAHKDVVLCADRPAPAPSKKESGEGKTIQWVVSIGGGGSSGELTAYSAKTGKRLWSSKCNEGYNSPVDVFVVDDLVWTGLTRRARDPGFTAARAVLSGEVKKRFPADPRFRAVGMPHHRCHRGKATARYILASKAGIEFVDLSTGKVLLHNWVRGACQYGILPANGLIYAPPHSCACFIKAMLSGFKALAPASAKAAAGASPARLERGSAYGAIGNRQSETGNSSDWPTYRHDAARSGATPSALPAELEPVWRVDIGGRITSPVIADRKVFLASVDTHTVHALNAKDGKRFWSYTTGGRVDSPPTIDGERVLFGSADGWVYCLRASDGALAWRFRAAPQDRRVTAYGQVESAWPVHGSVLVADGGVYFSAGRSSFLDGGIRLYRLDPATGRTEYETVVFDLDAATGEQPPARGFEMAGAQPAVLSSDGTSVYMRHRRFDPQCVEQKEAARHLFTPTGFLDGSWWHRSYWVYGARFSAGWGGWWRVGNSVPSGRLLVFDESSIYGFGRSFYPGGNAGQWSKGESYRFYATSKKLKTIQPPPSAKPAPREKGKKRRRRRPPARSVVKYRWTVKADVGARAMVLTATTLFAAGPLGKTHQQLDAFLGKRGVVLRAIATADGRTLAERKLDGPPVFDGMAAANGRLFLSCTDGTITCFSGQ